MERDGWLGRIDQFLRPNWVRLVAEADTVRVAVETRQSAAHCQRISVLVAYSTGTCADRYDTAVVAPSPSLQSQL